MYVFFSDTIIYNCPNLKLLYRLPYYEAGDNVSELKIDFFNVEKESFDDFKEVFMGSPNDEIPLGNLVEYCHKNKIPMNGYFAINPLKIIFMQEILIEGRYHYKLYKNLIKKYKNIFYNSEGEEHLLGYFRQEKLDLDDMMRVDLIYLGIIDIADHIDKKGVTDCLRGYWGHRTYL